MVTVNQSVQAWNKHHLQEQLPLDKPVEIKESLSFNQNEQPNTKAHHSYKL